MKDPDEGLVSRILKIIPTNKLTVKFIWKCKGSRMAKTILKKTRGIIPPGFKTYYKATVLMIVWNWQKDK